MRPDWDEYFLGIAEAVSKRADCTTRVGAVIVKNHRIVATGYNGTPPGDPRSCLRGDCPRDQSNERIPGSYANCLAIHAEQNAIAYSSHQDTDGATIYVTKNPCDMCSKLIWAAGIKFIKTSTLDLKL